MFYFQFKKKKLKEIIPGIVSVLIYVTIALPILISQLFVQTLYNIGFEALLGEVSMFIWFAVHHVCIYLPGRVCS